MIKLARFQPTVAMMLCLVTLLCILVYLPGLDGKFIFDDWQVILTNTRIQISDLSVESLMQAAKGFDSSLLGRPVVMVTFAVNYLVSGLSPFWFKVVNLGIHIATGVTLFFLTVLLMRYARFRKLLLLSRSTIHSVALLAMVLWLIHPMQLTVVLYVVQRMAGLAALFTVLALLTYSVIRVRQILDSRLRLWLLLLFGLWFMAAVFSKETGLLVPLFCLVIEIVFFRFRGAQGNLSAITVAVYFFSLGSVVYYLMTAGQVTFVGGYSGRDFNLGERLLTESRALWFYLKLLVLPSLADMTLYHDDFSVSRSLIAPFSTLWSVIGIFGLLLVALLARTRYVLLSFAILFFFAAHAIESSIIPLELVFEHRNYLAIYGVLVWLSAVVVSLAVDERKRKIVLLLVAVCVGLLSFVTFQRAELWGQSSQLLAHWLYWHPNSARTNMWAASSFENAIEGAPEQQAAEYQRKAIRYYLRAEEIQPTMCSALISIIIMEAKSSASVDLESLRSTTQCLTRSRLQAGTIYGLRAMVVSLADGSLFMPPVVVRELFVKALESPGVPAAERAVVLSNYGTYLGDVLGEWSSAAGFLNEAARIAPQRVNIRVQYARYLAESGDLEAARNALAIAEAMPPESSSLADIQKVRQLLR